MIVTSMQQGLKLGNHSEVHERIIFWKMIFHNWLVFYAACYFFHEPVTEVVKSFILNDSTLSN